MMVRLQYAFVNFFHENRGKRVVEVSNIKDFSPKFHGDFDKEKIYEVLWPHIPNEDSFSNEGYYEARIICLGESISDIQHEARSKGSQRIPENILNVLKASQQKKAPEKQLRTSSRGRNIKPSQVLTEETKITDEPHARSKKKKKSSQKEKVGEKRMQAILETYTANSLLEPFSHTPKSLKKGDDFTENSPVTSSADKKKGTDTLHTANDTMKLEKTWQDESPELAMDVQSVLNCDGAEVCELTDNVDSCLIDDPPTKRFCTRRMKLDPVEHDRVLPFKRGKQLDTDSSMSTDVSDIYTTSDQERDLFLNKVRRLEAELKRQKDDFAVVENNLTSAQLQVRELKKENARLSKVNLGLSENLLNRLQLGLVTKNPEIPAAGQFQFSGNKPPSSTPTHPTGESATETPAGSPAPATGSPAGSPAPAASLAAKVLFSCEESTGDTLSAITVKKKKRDETHEEGIAKHETLGKMIFDAIQKNVELQRDGTGKVHIGNGVWLPEKLFSDKIAKPQVSPSIALRDATGCIYKSEELAERSLEGGTPVKSTGGLKIKKKKMTPAKREALLGLYRAKVQQTAGSSDQCFLNLAVKKQGKSILREKLKEANKKKMGKKCSLLISTATDAPDVHHEQL